MLASSLEFIDLRRNLLWLIQVTEVAGVFHPFQFHTRVFFFDHHEPRYRLGTLRIRLECPHRKRKTITIDRGRCHLKGPVPTVKIPG